MMQIIKDLSFTIFSSKQLLHIQSFAHFLFLNLKHPHLPWRPTYTWLSRKISVYVEITEHNNDHDGYSHTTREGILLAV